MFGVLNVMEAKVQRPRVSIGLPVYNGERYVSEAIGSTCAQTFTDFELIVSDNGSTDGTQDICERAAVADPRIRYIRHTVNRGAYWNFRHVFERARGKYFRWLSADDAVAPESLACCVEVLDRHADVVLCYPKTTLIDASGSVIAPYEDRLDLQSSSPVERFRMAVERIGLVNVHYGLMRIDDVMTTRLMMHYPNADIVFLLELVLRGKFYEIDRPLFYRRMHQEASSSMKGNTQALQAYFDTSRTDGVGALQWRIFIDQIKAVYRGSLTLTEQFRLWYFLFRRAVSCREVYMEELVDLFRRMKPRMHKL